MLYRGLEGWLLEEQGSLSSMHVVAQGMPEFSFGLCEHWASMRCTDINLGNTLIYSKVKQTNKLFKKCSKSSFSAQSFLGGCEYLCRPESHVYQLRGLPLGTGLSLPWSLRQFLPLIKLSLPWAEGLPQADTHPTGL